MKTHGRWRLREPVPGVFEWRSPHGYRFRIDHTGTHPLGKDPGDQRHDPAAVQERAEDPPMVAVWVSPFELDLTELIAHAS